MFRMRNPSTGTGQGLARVQVTGFVSKSLTLQSGNIGVVRLQAGMDPPPEIVTRSFQNDIYPLFNELGCAGCHTPPDGPGFVQSPTRCGQHLDLSASVDKVYASLTAQGDYDSGVCDAGIADAAPNAPADGGTPCNPPQRICLSSPESSLVLKKPLAAVPPLVPDHPNTSFDGVSDPNYQAILQWIQQGARR
jgi:hypothetical protein